MRAVREGQWGETQGEVKRNQAADGAVTGGKGRLPTGIQAWLFDFDNTLAALEENVDWAASRAELEAYLRARGVAASFFRAIPKRNLLLYEAVRADLQGAGPDREPGRIELLRGASEIVERHEMAGAAKAPALRGAIELLGALRKRKLPSAIVTSNSSRTVHSWLARHHCEGAIRVVVGRERMMPLKPDPSMLAGALAELGAAADEAIFIGDSEADLLAARSLGVYFAAIAAKHDAREAIRKAGAHDIFDSPVELATRFGLLATDESGPRG
jgi:HAD superfamily hydrolase (TIGR01509 family)